MKRAISATLLLLALVACSGGDAAPEPAAGTETTATTETRASNYGDAIVNAQKKAQKMADEQSERAKGVDQVMEETGQQ